MDNIFFLVLLLLLAGGGVLTWWVLRRKRASAEVLPSTSPSLPSLSLSMSSGATSLSMSSGATFGNNELAKQMAPPLTASQGFNRGVLAHMIAISDAQRLLGTKPFSLKANDPCIADCSQPLFNTCSAWTYLRTDLMPSVFCMPSGGKNAEGTFQYNTPVIGLIVDPAKLQQYITGMAVTDSNTVQRICGANNQGSPSTNQSLPSLWNMFDDGAATPQVAWGELGPDFKGSRLGNCQKIDGCGDDAACQAVYSGNSVLNSALGVQPSIPSDDLGPSTSKDKTKNVSFAGLKEGAKPEILKNWGKACWPSNEDALTTWPENGCKLMHYTNFCARQAPTGVQSTAASAGGSPTFVDDGAENAGNVVGDDGLGVLAAYVDEKTAALRHTWDATLLTCKFRRDDFELWTNSLKGYYKAWLKAYSVPSAGVSPPAYNINLSPIWQGNRDNSNFMLANPFSKHYLENELNVYVHPPSAVKSLQEKQNQDLRDAVLGFFFVGKTCLEFHAELDNTTSQCAWTQDERPKPIKNAQDICQGFLCTETPNGSTPIDQGCITDLVEGESKYITVAQQLASQLQQAFNATYRSGKQQVGLFKYTGGSNTFFDYNTLKKWESGSLKSEDFFVEASGAAAAAARPESVHISPLPLRRQGPPSQALTSPP